MYGLFRVTKEGVVIDKDALKLIPELARLSKEELRYIILVYDWFDSPIRKRPPSHRKIIAKRQIWKGKNVDPEKREVVKKGIEVYKAICYDHTRSSADAIRTKIDKLNKKLVVDDDMTTTVAKTIIEQLSFFSDRLDKLEHEIKAEDLNFGEIKGKLEPSFIEIWQRRMQLERKGKELENNL